MHGYYLHYRDIYNKDRVQTGIDRKVLNQINAFNKAGCGCEFVFCPQPETTASMVKSCMPGCSDGILWPDVERFDQADYLYIRRPRFASKELLSFLRQFKKKNPESLVIYEVPTYPYDGEMSNIKMICALLKDKKNRKEFQRYIDYIADLSGAPTIFGIPTVPITNGINLESIPIKDFSKTTNNVVNIISVAYFEPWHGIDRFLRGMAHYYQRNGTREIYLHLVGGGSQTAYLKKLCERMSLSEKVTFYGAVKSEDIRPIYDICSIAIECLGIHRKSEGMLSASLKSREYLAKGIPFIHSAPIDIFKQKPVDFCLRVPEDESPIDIEKLLFFHDSLYGKYTHEQVVHNIRKYAEDTVSMDKAMGSVIRLLKDEFE